MASILGLKPLMEMSIEELVKQGYSWDNIFFIKGVAIPEILTKSDIASIELRGLIKDGMGYEKALAKVQEGITLYETEKPKSGEAEPDKSKINVPVIIAIIALGFIFLGGLASED